MDSLKKHGDPLDEEIRPEAARGSEVVTNNQPGSKGDGARDRAGAGGRVESDLDADHIERSANQKPNPAHPSDDATMTPGGNRGEKRNTM